MKKLLVPTVALFAFSMLCMSATAPISDYYVVRFFGSASGCCWVYAGELDPDPEPTASGSGRFHISGLAMAHWNPDYELYWAASMYDAGTFVRVYRDCLRVTWDSEVVLIHLRPAENLAAYFYDNMDTIMMYNMSFSGYWRGRTGLQYFKGNNATMWHGLMGPPGEEALVSMVTLYLEGTHFVTLAWAGEEIEDLPPGCLAKSITHKVMVWPRGWPAWD